MNALITTGHVLFSIVTFVGLLFVSPSLIGNLMCRGLKDRLSPSLAYRFIIGFMTVLAIWMVFALPFMTALKDRPFHELRYVYFVTIVLLSAYSIIQMYISGIRPDMIATEIKRRIFSFCGTYYERIYVVITAAILLFQLFETAYFAPVGYVQDDFYYYIDINDTVYTDVSCFTGPKQTLAQWYAFIAAVSSTTHVHPLILCRTLVPMFAIVLIYMTLYAFGVYCFNENISMIRIFLMWAAIILEVLSYSYYLFFMALYVTTWGKIITGMVAVPILLLSFVSATMTESADTKNTIRHAIVLLAVGAGAATLSFASMIAGSIGLFLIMIVFLVKYRKKEAVIYAAASELPFIVQMLAYVLFF